MKCECPWCGYESGYWSHMSHMLIEHPTFIDKYGEVNESVREHKIPEREAEDVIVEAEMVLDRSERKLRKY